MSVSRQRLDHLLTERGLATSRQKAQALILAGAVMVNGQRSDKPGKLLPVDARIDVTAQQPYVSRGGYKLAAALDYWSIHVEGTVCLDVGASTGGFTDCLLQRGAVKVYAFDVGTAQLDWKLRTDPRVICREGINARYLTVDDLPEKVRLIVCDVSFISITMILPALPPLLQEGGELAILVKPQFEVGRHQVGKGGIVRDPELHQEVINKVAAAAQALGFKTESIESPILGAEGNKEFLLHASY
jgi:23S rRNA (cytidine1920-2'-O)/16S rRNA (cytidine1409-2'-O)-methyltransferase